MPLCLKSIWPNRLSSCQQSIWPNFTLAQIQIMCFPGSETYAMQHGPNAIPDAMRQNERAYKQSQSWISGMLPTELGGRGSIDLFPRQPRQPQQQPGVIQGKPVAGEPVQATSQGQPFDGQQPGLGNTPVVQGTAVPGIPMQGCAVTGGCAPGPAVPASEQWSNPTAQRMQQQYNGADRQFNDALDGVDEQTNNVCKQCSIM